MSAKTITSVAGLFLGTLLCAPAWAGDAAQPSEIATPGTVNYVEGQVSIGQQVLNLNSVGSVKLNTNQYLFTGYRQGGNSSHSGRFCTPRR